MKTRTQSFKHAVVLSAYLLLVWGMYRFLFRLPEEIEEGIVKPILFLLPVWYLVRLEKERLSSVGVTLRNLFPGAYLAIGLGSAFAIVAFALNYLKNGTLNFGANIGDLPFGGALALTLATAVSEEIAFRGYLLSRLQTALKSEITGNLVTSVIWTAIHIPNAIFILKLDLISILLYLGLIFMFGLGSGIVVTRTKNIFSSILIHVLWEWPVILFR